MPDEDGGAAAPRTHTAEIKRLRRVFSGFLNIDEALVRHSRYDGGSQEVVRLSLDRGDTVAIALVDRRRRVIFLTEQFRFPTFQQGPGWLQEIPAGDLRAGESAEAAAKREVFEETGFVIDNMEPVVTFYASPGGSSERIFLFFAEVDGLTRDDAGALAARDPWEDIATVEQDLEVFLENCRAGRVLDGKTLVAGLWLTAHRSRLGL